MPVVHANMGEAVHKLRDGRSKRFAPHGTTWVYRGGKLESGSERARKAPAGEDVEHLGTGRDTLSARLFVGLNVGDKPTYTIEDIVDAIVEIRGAQHAAPDASILAQKGIYTERDSGKLIEEDSVQIIVLEFEKDEKEFTRLMTDLGERLCKRFHQKEVIVEIQVGGIARGVYRAFA